MAKTIRIPPDRLSRFFEDFTKRFLRDGSPEAVNVELITSDLGHQVEAQGPRLLGVTYDPRVNGGTGALEFELEDGDHRVYRPSEAWAMQEDDGFVSSVEVVAADGRREVVEIKRVGLRRRDDAPIPRQR
jgi:hypothetical protein